MYQSSPFIPRKIQLNKDSLRDAMKEDLRRIQSKNLPILSREQIADIISPEEFNLLQTFLHNPKLNDYLSQYIQNYPDIKQLIADIKKINFAIEEAIHEEQADSLIKAANSTRSIFNQSLFDMFSLAWDRTIVKANFDKAKVLLDMYLGSEWFNIMFFRENFRTETWGRQHFTDIKAIKSKCDNKEIKDIYHLLSALGNIKIKNPQGHLQAIITVIARKLNAEEQKQIETEQRSRRSGSSLSFHSY
jgi:hypothetical protein